MEKLDLIIRNLEEVLTPKDLKTLIKLKNRLVHYIGFEISGYLHIGSAFLSCLKIKDFQKAGVHCNIFLADWHSYINEKLNGDLKTIKKVAINYYQQAFKLCLELIGGNSQKLNFILGSDLYHNNNQYWLTFIEIGKNTTLARVQRSIDIMGRKMGEVVDFAKLCYPLMQVADIFAIKANMVHAGLDQRKAHVIARDVALKLKFMPLLNRKREKIKPIALHHHILLGLSKPQVIPQTIDELKERLTDLKMSKSKPESAVFIHDSSDTIERKIIKAFCPPKETIYNPPLDWLYWLILPIKGEVKIKTKNGFKIYQEKNRDSLIKDYQEELIHPLDLKEALIKALTELISPIYQYYQKKENLKILKELADIQK